MDITKVHYDPAAAITVKAKKKIPAGTFVVPADDIVGRTPVVDIAAADAYPFGVVAHDVDKDGYVTVYRAGHVLDALAAGAFVAGDKLSTAADGKVVKAAAGPVVAIALTKGASGKSAPIALL